MSYDPDFEHDIQQQARLIEELATIDFGSGAPLVQRGVTASFDVQCHTASEADSLAFDRARQFYVGRRFRLGAGDARPLAYSRSGEVAVWEVHYTAWEIGPFDDDDDDR